MRAFKSGALAALGIMLASCTQASQPWWDVVIDMPSDTMDADGWADVPDAVDAPDLFDAPDTTAEPDVPADGMRDTIGMVCGTDDDCQNGIFCDGREICPYGFCTRGDPTTICEDEDDCTIDECHEDTASCTHALIDGDGDLHPPESCGGDDCDDTDSGVHPDATEICGDGTDQNCDGADGDMGTCGCPEPITRSGTYTGTTSGSSMHSPSTCGSGGGPEWVYVITPTTTSSVTFATLGTSYDTCVYVRSTSCTTGTEVGCDDDGGSSLDSRLTVSLSAGTTYYFFMDGYSSSYMGPFTLTVSGL